jgi:hypothetical protein
MSRLASEGRYKVRAVGRSEQKARDVLALPDIEYAGADSKKVNLHRRLTLVRSLFATGR